MAWADLKEGVEIRLCNTGSDAVAGIFAELTGFSFADAKGGAIPTGDVLAATGAGTRLAAGECRNVTLERSQAKTAATPSSATAEGVLAVGAPGEEVERIVVKVSGPPAAKPATGGKQKLNIARLLPREGDFYSEVLVVNLPAGLAAGTKPKPPPKELGNVVNGDDVGAVKRRGEWELVAPGVAKLPIAIEGLGDTGTYSGKLDLAGTGKAGDAFELDVELKDSVWMATAALLLGAALLVLTELYLRRWRVEGLLRVRVDDIGRIYRGNTPPIPCFHPPTCASLDEYTDALEEAISTYARSTFYFDTTSEPYAKIDASIELARDDALYLFAPTGLAKALDDLAAAAGRLAGLVAEGRLRVDREPALIASAKRLLRGATLEVGEARKRGREAEACVELIDVWIGLAKQLLRHQRWAAELAAREIPSSRDRRTLAAASGRIAEARNELLEAGDEATLERLGTADDLTRVYVDLARLGGRYGVWVTSPDDAGRLEVLGTAGEPAPTAADDLLDQRFGPLLWPPTGAVAESVAPDPPTRESDAAPAEPVTLRRSLRWVGDGAVILLGVAAATVLALGEVYFGKPFGTWEDYLKLVFAGTAGAGIAKGFTGTLVTLRGGTLSPPVESDPKPAE